MLTIYISKSDSTLSVDWDKMPENAQRHIIEYGLRQKLNDAGSAATTKELGKDEAGKQALSMAENVLSALMEGKVTVRSAASSMTLEERAFAKVVRAFYKKLIGKPADDFDVDNAVEQIAKKAEKSLEDTRAALELKAQAEAKVMAEIAKIKAESLIDIEL